MQRFVLLAMASSGSYMLGSALNAHPRIKFYGELLKKNPLVEIDYLDFHERERDAQRLLARRLDDPLGFVDRVLSTQCDAEAVGFKLMLGQNDVAVHHFLSDPATPKLLLRRDNVLAAYSSQMIARETGQGIAMKTDWLRRTRVRFVAGDFERFRKRRERLYSHARERLAATQQSYCEIEYRCAVNGYGTARAIDFLGLDSALPPDPATRRRNTDCIIDRFSNPDEVFDYMAEIGRQNWLESELKDTELT